MRLAVIAPHFPEYTVNYARGMSHLYDVMACVDGEELRLEYEGRDIPAEGIHKLYRMKFKTPVDLVKLVVAILKFKPDIVHFQEAVGPRRGLFSACVARLLKSSALIVVTVHDPLPHGGRDAQAARKGEWIRRYVRRLADIVVVHGDYCRALYQSAEPRAGQTVVVSQHGLILEPPILETKSSATFRLYMFGRMESYKGLEVLLRAAESLHRSGLDFELAIEGRGPELDRLQAGFESLPEVTIFNGFVPPIRIIASIQAADCVVLPYLSATQSGVLAAAFAGRRYVIASDTGGFPDIVKHRGNGILAPPGDSRALAQAIRELAADPDLRQRLSEGAALTATAKLDWNRIARELAQAFTRASHPGSD